MAYEIEKGIPIPPIVRGRPRKYNLDKLAIGESITVDIDLNNASNVANYWREKTGMQFDVVRVGKVVSITRLA